MGILSRIFGSNKDSGQKIEPQLVDDAAQQITDYVVFDLETSGLYPERHKIIEIAGIKVVGGEVESVFSTFVNYRGNLSPKVQELTGIVASDLINAPSREYVMRKFDEFIGDLPLVGHNIIDFDNKFLHYGREYVNLPPKTNALIDTLVVSRSLFNSNSYTLSNLCEAFGIEIGNTHRALDDAKLTLKLFEKIKQHSSEQILPKTVTYSPSAYQLKPDARHFKKSDASQDRDHIAGKRFCITTFKPFARFKKEADLFQFIVDSGGMVGSLTQKTDYLIDCDPNYTSSKEKRARESNKNGKSHTKIISPEEFVDIAQL